VSIDKFINDVNWLDIIGLHCLISLAGMLSNPEAFLYLFYQYFFQFYQMLYAGIQNFSPHPHDFCIPNILG
jgi:hypothetical protein